MAWWTFFSTPAVLELRDEFVTPRLDFSGRQKADGLPLFVIIPINISNMFLEALTSRSMVLPQAL
jgi:hypothetical protein